MRNREVKRHFGMMQNKHGKMVQRAVGELVGKQQSQESDADPHGANHQRTFSQRLPSPQWSIATIKSLDISSNIPDLAVAMDAEDSPWGGTSTPVPM